MKLNRSARLLDQRHNVKSLGWTSAALKSLVKLELLSSIKMNRLVKTMPMHLQARIIKEIIYTLFNQRLITDIPKASGSGSSEEKTHADHIEPIYFKGTSRRIYGELYKVIDSSDVILHILDARDPLGTMCESVLEYIRKEKAHKQVVLIINKCDLVPNWVTVSRLIGFDLH